MEPQPIIADLHKERATKLKETPKRVANMCKAVRQLYEEGREKKLLENFRSMMKKLNINAKEAMEMLDVSEADQSKYEAMLSEQE